MISLSSIFIFLILATLASTLKEERSGRAAIIKKRSIFLRGSNENYCKLKCGEQNHTMCNPCGKNFYEYPVDKEFREVMLDGHNGIRDRIAGIMRVANMQKLRWDFELSLMAKYWLRRCDFYKVDPCTKLPRTSIEDDDTVYTFVTQGTEAIISLYYPLYFRAATIRTWYFEKNTMKPPRIEKISESISYGYFDVSNNFTQISFAYASRLGCAMVKSNEIYAIACNYWPYEGKKRAFRLGQPTEYCPNLYPIPSLKYKNLCEDRGSTIIINYTSIFLLNMLAVFNFQYFWFVKFLIN
ncbi:uncharacterized protein LOC119650242 isoform X2 [Hermetia illucens]|uniref:uncharacterized protein LOC119650242 isoform X2 n=1 Tax=Hermetia illucens TaxID=343691 RepID=UPI0018CC394B|nr:uncharacterized protein LOC119650242 isoform X2 [Hermetia illucens]